MIVTMLVYMDQRKWLLRILSYVVADDVTIITGSEEQWLNQVKLLCRQKIMSILITKLLWSTLKIKWGYNS